MMIKHLQSLLNTLRCVCFIAQTFNVLIYLKFGMHFCSLVSSKCSLWIMVIIFRQTFISKDVI